MRMDADVKKRSGGSDHQHVDNHNIYFSKFAKWKLQLAHVPLA